MNKLREFAEHVLREQLAHGEHGDAEYINMAQTALATLDDTYNGFSNRETWAVVDWVSGDEALLAAAQTFMGQGGLVGPFLEQAMRTRPNVQRRIGSLWRVNWDEAAAALSSDTSSETELTEETQQ